MSKSHTPYKPKTAVLETGGETLLLDGRATLAQLLKEKKLYDLEGVSKITGLCVRYLRRLCHGERGRRIAHVRLLGRYYMTPAQVAELLEPIKGTKPA